MHKSIQEASELEAQHCAGPASVNQKAEVIVSPCATMLEIFAMT